MSTKTAGAPFLASFVRSEVLTLDNCARHQQSAAREQPKPSSNPSPSLRRELGLLDLILAQILIVIVPDFFGTAVKAGPSHVVLWLSAMLIFFIPQALVVAHLNRLMPLEGGLYEWARLAFGDQIGFLVAWNIWLFIMLYVAIIGLVTTTFIAYAVPSLSWIADNKWAVARRVSHFDRAANAAGRDRLPPG